MVAILSRLFNIRPYEWPRLLFIYGMGMVFLIGLTWGETIADALFLSKVGVDSLPALFLLEAVITMIALAIFSAFADRIRDDVLLIGILVLGALGVLTSRLLAGLGETGVAYPMLYLASRVIRDVFNVQFWTYVNSFYDTRSAKRVIPVIATAARIAGAVAGLTMPLITQFLLPIDVSFAWVGTLVLMSLMVWAMPRLIKERVDVARSGSIQTPLTPAAPKKGRGGIGAYLNNIREGYRFVAKSSFLRWMAASTLLLIVFTTLIQFQGSAIFAAELKDEKAIADYLGTLTGITNLVMLPIQLFILGRLVGWLGLGVANLIYPITMLGISGLLIGMPRSLFAAAASHFARTTYRTAFRNTLDNLMYNAVPLRVKGRSRAFIGGFVMPIGTIIGGGLLLIRQELTQLPWLLPTLIGVFALFYAGSAFVLRRQYARALISMLEQEDYSFLLTEGGELAINDPTALAALKKKFDQSENLELRRFLAQLMLEIGGGNAVSLLAQSARESDAPTRAAIADVLVASELRGEDVRALLTELLNDTDGAVRRAAASGLKTLAYQNPSQFAASALKLMRDPELSVRLEAAPMLIQSGDFYYAASALRALAPVFADSDPNMRAEGVRLLGLANDVRFIDDLMEYLSDSSDTVRLEAALSIESLCRRSNVPHELTMTLARRLTGLLDDPVERVRMAALNIFAYLKSSEAQIGERTLIRFLGDPSQDIRETAIDGLVRIGSPALKSLAPLIGPNVADRVARRSALVAISRIERERAVEPIRAVLQENLLMIHANYVRMRELESCNQYRGIKLLCEYLSETSDTYLAEIFYLLSALHDQRTVSIIAESLRSDQPRVRANALEALEGVVSPALLRWFSPLFNPEMDATKRLQISRDLSNLKGDSAAILRALMTDVKDPTARAIAIYALGEIAPPGDDSHTRKTAEMRAIPPETIQAPAAAPTTPHATPTVEDTTTSQEKTIETSIEKPATRRPRRSAADLLGALSDDPKPAPATPEPQTAPPPNIKAESSPVPVSENPLQTEVLFTPRKLAETLQSSEQTPEAAPTITLNACQRLFSREEVTDLLSTALHTDSDALVRAAAGAAIRHLSGTSVLETAKSYEGIMLSPIEKIIFLKEVSFFEGMTVDQLKILASVCEERVFQEETEIFAEGAVGGVLYVVVRGKVALEREGQRKGSTMRIATLGAYGYFGEMSLFDNSPVTEKALAIQDTLCLALRREPLLQLTRRNPDLSLKLINVLSRRLREATDRIAQLSSTRPRELHKLFDKLD